MNSGIVFAGSDGLTTTISAACSILATGVMSRAKLKSIVIERLVNRAGRAGQQKRVAIRHRMGDKTSADVGAGAAAVFDDDLLVETLRHCLCDEPRDNVERAAGRDRNDETDQLARIGVCTREP